MTVHADAVATVVSELTGAAGRRAGGRAAQVAGTAAQAAAGRRAPAGLAVGFAADRVEADARALAAGVLATQQRATVRARATAGPLGLTGIW